MGGRSGADGGPGGERALGAALRLLGARALSAREVGDRLARRGFAPDEIDSTLASLLERGYLDDQSLAYTVAASRAKRLFGRPRVVAELKRRGVSAGVIDEAVSRAFAEIDEGDLARQAAAKLGGGHPSPASPSARARMARALMRRGFSAGAVFQVLGAEPTGSARAPLPRRRVRPETASGEGVSPEHAKRRRGRLETDRDAGGSEAGDDWVPESLRIHDDEFETDP